MKPAQLASSRKLLVLIVVVTSLIAVCHLAGCSGDNLGSEVSVENSEKANTSTVSEFNNVYNEDIDPNVKPVINENAMANYYYVNEDPYAPIHQFAILCRIGEPPTFRMDNLGNPYMIENYGADTFNAEHAKETEKYINEGKIELPNAFFQKDMRINEDNSFYVYQGNSAGYVKETIDGRIIGNKNLDYLPEMMYQYTVTEKPGRGDYLYIPWRINGNMNDLYTITIDQLEYVYGPSNQYVKSFLDKPQTFRYVGALVYE